MRIEQTLRDQEPSYFSGAFSKLFADHTVRSIEEKGLLAFIVTHPWFQTLTFVIIGLMTVSVVVLTGMQDTPTKWVIFRVLHYTFTCILLADWGVRVLHDRTYPMKGREEITYTIFVWLPVLLLIVHLCLLHEDAMLLHYEIAFDAARVTERWLSIADDIVESKWMKSGEKNKRALWMLVTGLMSSAGTVIASVLVLLFFSLAVAIVFADLLHGVYFDPDDPDAPDFRTVLSTVFELLSIARSDNADTTMEYLVDVGTSTTGLIYNSLHFYRFLVELVIFNLITAVIVNNAMKVLRADKDKKIKAAKEKTQRQIKELGQLFANLQVDERGELDLYQFLHSEGKSFRNKLEILGIDEEDVEEMFRALDSHGEGHDNENPTVNLVDLLSHLPQFFGECKSFTALIVTKKIEAALTLLYDAITQLAAKGRRKGAEGKLSVSGDVMKENSPEFDMKEFNAFTDHFDGELSRLDTKVETCMQQCELIAEALKKPQSGRKKRLSTAAVAFAT